MLTENLVPVANVTRQMRRVIPNHGEISGDAILLIQECVSEFIRLIMSEVHSRCGKEMRKTITAEDVLIALNHLGFYRFISPLFIFLNRFREFERHHERPSLSGEPEVIRKSLQPEAMGISAAFGAMRISDTFEPGSNVRFCAGWS